MRTKIRSSRALIALLVAGGLLMSFGGPVVAQQSPQLVANYVASLPTEPASPAWSDAQAADIPLTAQLVALPRLTQVTVASVSVRSLTDGERIAFRLEWQDTTRNAHATRPDEFRDAAAMMFPIGNFLPNICMGTPGQLTNLWHWKADWQEDLDKGFQDVVDAYPNFYKDSYPFVTGQPPYRAPGDFASPDAQRYLVGLAARNPLALPNRGSPVEELVSAGFGTGTHKQAQGVAGKGAWVDGTWQVVFNRELGSADSTGAQITPRGSIPVAFAVWNGANQEVGARKQVSSFVTVKLGGPPTAAPPAAGGPGWGWLWVMLAGTALVLAGGLMGWYHGQQEGRRRRYQQRTNV